MMVFLEHILSSTVFLVLVFHQSRGLNINCENSNSENRFEGKHGALLCVCNSALGDKFLVIFYFFLEINIYFVLLLILTNLLYQIKHLEKNYSVKYSIQE